MSVQPCLHFLECFRTQHPVTARNGRRVPAFLDSFHSNLELLHRLMALEGLPGSGDKVQHTGAIGLPGSFRHPAICWIGALVTPQRFQYKKFPEHIRLKLAKMQVVSHRLANREATGLQELLLDWLTALGVDHLKLFRAESADHGCECYRNICIGLADGRASHVQLFRPEMLAITL